MFLFFLPVVPCVRPEPPLSPSILPSALCYYTRKFTLAPLGIRVTSSNDEQIGLSLKQLSESERFRLGVVFQIALATVRGVRFVVIDLADLLDKERRKLTGLLLHSDIDQAIVLATGEESPPTAVPPREKFFDLTRVRESVKEGVIEPPLAIDIRHQGRHDAPETSLPAPRPTP